MSEELGGRTTTKLGTEGGGVYDSQGRVRVLQREVPRQLNFEICE